eukprot:SAG11_NODE_3188_length_2623_cov_11.721078_1_plen_160_part_00
MTWLFDANAEYNDQRHSLSTISCLLKFSFRQPVGLHAVLHPVCAHVRLAIVRVRTGAHFTPTARNTHVKERIAPGRLLLMWSDRYNSESALMRSHLCVATHDLKCTQRWVPSRKFVHRHRANKRVPSNSEFENPRQNTKPLRMLVDQHTTTPPSTPLPS